MSESKTISQLLGNNFVNLYVGPTRHCYTVHRDFICHRFKFFNKAFSGNFQEAQQGSMEFPEDDPLVFGKVMDWLYLNDFDVDCTCLITCQWSGKPEISAEHELFWCRFYILADKLCIEDLAEIVLAKFTTCLDYARSDETIRAETVDFVYSHTVESSKLRAAIVAEFCQRVKFKEGDNTGRRKLFETIKSNDEFGVDVLTHLEKCYTWQKASDGWS